MNLDRPDSSPVSREEFEAHLRSFARVRREAWGNADVWECSIAGQTRRVAMHYQPTEEYFIWVNGERAA